VNIKKSTLFAGMIGNILEHYDHALYGFLAPLLASLFFSQSDPVYGLICAYALMPLGFVAKPFGALVFGWLGNRFGNKRVLSLTLCIMAVATAAIGFLPVYEQVGWIAPVLLALARLLQNFSSIGETTGGALFLLDQTEQRKQGWISSLFDASSILGILLASIAAFFFSDYWRYLFWAGSLSGLAGWILRASLIKEQSCKLQVNFKEILAEWRTICSIAAVVGYAYSNYYLITNFLNGFLPLVSSISRKEALGLNSILLTLDLCLLPLFGWLTLYIKKENLMLGALTAGALLLAPLFCLLDEASITTAASIRITLMLIGVCFSAPYYAWARDRCKSATRFSTLSLGFALGSGLIGGTTPALSLWLYQQTTYTLSAALPVFAAACLAGWALLQHRSEERSASLSPL
jgi:MFS family permease